MAEKAKHIDHLVREKLSRLQPPYDAASWDQLSDRLDLSERTEDELLREKMQQLKPDYAAASWMQLSEKLSASEAQLDETVRTKLRSVRPAFNENSWAMLSARIEQQNRRAQTIFSYKFAELSLLLLFLFLFWQFGPLTPVPQDYKELPDPVATPQQIAPALQPSNVPENAIPLAAFDPSTTPTANADQVKKQTAHLAQANLQTKTLYSLSGSFTQLNIRAAQNKIQLPDLLPSIAMQGVDQANLVDEFKQQVDEFLTSETVFSAVDALASVEWMSPVSNYPGDDLDLLTRLKPVERKTFFRVGFAGSPDYNRVITPAIDIPGRDTAIGLDRYSLGYSGGMTFGIERGRWEVELGALYAVRTYENLPIIALAGNIREGYQGVSLKKNELNTLNVPLNFRYNFFVHDKWRIYGLTGGAINSVLQANYYVVNEEAFNLDFEARPGPNNSRSDLADELPVSTMPQGILEGGRFWSNTSIQVNVGFGLERYMSHRWSIFAQPTYQHAVFSPFRGYGPYRDRIHSMSILMGMKVKL